MHIHKGKARKTRLISIKFNPSSRTTLVHLFSARISCDHVYTITNINRRNTKSNSWIWSCSLQLCGYCKYISLEDTHIPIFPLLLQPILNKYALRSHLDHSNISLLMADQCSDKDHNCSWHRKLQLLYFSGQTKGPRPKTKINMKYTVVLHCLT